jgi:hypothetical protein
MAGVHSLTLERAPMIGKLLIGLTAIATVSLSTPMSTSAAEHKGVTVTIPKQVCETLHVETQNWGKQTVQVCGPPGPRAHASGKERHIQYK